MMQHLKRNVWAALLTIATLFSITGCAEDETTESSVDLSNISSAMVEPGSTEAVATDFAYIMNADGTISISGYTGSATDLEVPGTIDGYVVTAIGDHAFEANWDIKSITLPEGLTTIGESAFSDCGNLTAVSIPETVGTIRRGAFISCTSLTSLFVPVSVSEIMEEAFTGCSALTDLTIAGEHVTYQNWWLDAEDCAANLNITCRVGSDVETWAKQNNIATTPLS